MFTSLNLLFIVVIVGAVSLAVAVMFGGESKDVKNVMAAINSADYFVKQDSRIYAVMFKGYQIHNEKLTQVFTLELVASQRGDQWEHDHITQHTRRVRIASLKTSLCSALGCNYYHTDLDVMLNNLNVKTRHGSFLFGSRELFCPLQYCQHTL